jgi:dihydrofolate synthase/folylpolyglutamate synthase
MFEQQGISGYKEGLDNTLALDEHFGHPHLSYATIHVAGTNGKGSVSHSIASVLQECGYRVGLYTSPHLADFSERIRINGTPISQDYVVNFVDNERAFFEPLHPSFFEVTTAMAFKYFKDNNVDIAVIEVGLGGRLDCTNIITPLVSVITNISYDHTQLLGDTLAKIAAEKAGINLSTFNGWIYRQKCSLADIIELGRKLDMTMHMEYRRIESVNEAPKGGGLFVTIDGLKYYCK